jgi:hypothetical protein
VIADTLSNTSDAAYIVITRAKGKCAICLKKGTDTVAPIVPVSYGGDPTDPANLVATHSRCAELRHQIEGSSPEPPDPDGLRRLIGISKDMRQFALGILHRAAVEHRRKVTYSSVDGITLLGRSIEANLGYALHGRPCPDGISAEDWAWLQSPAAFDALHGAAWALLASEG